MPLKSSLCSPRSLASIALVLGLCLQAQPLRAEDNDAEGKVVLIAPDAEVDDFDVEPKTRIVEEPVYWIGIHGRSVESDVLRTHLQLAEEMGVVVEEVLPKSPAAKAGLRRHDIILRVNNDAVDNMQVLQSQVRASKEKPLELEIIRLGKQEKLVIIPELIPENMASNRSRPANAFGQFNGQLQGRNLEGDMMQQLLEQLGARNLGFGANFRENGFRDNGQRLPEARRLNPNQIPNGQMPNGLSISIQRNNNGPAKIIVKQGDKTWQIEDNDPESLNQLPDDVRPFVQRMLRGQNVPQPFDIQPPDFDAEMQDLLPPRLGGLPRAADPTQKRIEALEQKLQKLMQDLQDERQ